VNSRDFDDGCSENAQLQVSAEHREKAAVRSDWAARHTSLGVGGRTGAMVHAPRPQVGLHDQW